MVKNYNNNLESLNELKELKLHREKEINEIRKEKKKKLNVLINKINDVLKELEFKLEHGTLKNRYSKKSNSREDRIKLKLSWKGQINEIKRLKGVEKNENTLLD